jgi:DNA topoisomerase-3
MKVQRSITGSPYLKNYVFDYTFGPPWGQSNVTFTSVVGHIVKRDFPERYNNWQQVNPSDLFEAPIETTVEEVDLSLPLQYKS